MKNIAITGGAGFIGSHLVDKLIKDDGSRVTVIDNFSDFYSPAVKRANTEPHLSNSRYRLIEADICDRDQISRVFENAGPFDAIIHLAACAGVRPSIADPLGYYRTNVEGTLNVLEAARQQEKIVPHFVFGSSSSVYGESLDPPFSERANVSKPISPYAATKVAGELLCHTYSHIYDIRTVCLRFFTVYGSRQRPDLAIHKFARLMIEGKPIEVFGDGSTKRDYTYVGDTVRGIEAALCYRGRLHDVFNIGGGATVPLNRLIELLEKNLGVPAVIRRLPHQMGDVPVTCAEMTKSSEILGFVPQIRIEEGIAIFAEWAKTQYGEPRREIPADTNINQSPSVAPDPLSGSSTSSI